MVKVNTVAASSCRALAAGIRFPSFALPHPAAAGAAGSPLEVTARSHDGLLEAELIEEERDFVLEVRSRAQELNYRLVGYALRGVGEGEVVEGFLVLRPDVEGWYAAQARFDPERLYIRLRGRCEEVLVVPIEVGAVAGAGEEALLAAAGAGRGAPDERVAWLAWIAAAEPGADRETLALLNRVREQLAGATTIP